MQTPRGTRETVPYSDLNCEAEADIVWDSFYAKQAKLDYDRNHWPKVRQDLVEMRADFPPEFAKECRRKYLLQRLQEAKNSTDTKNVERLEMQVAAFLGKAKITDDDIQRAREYPLRTLLNVKRGHLATCPFHTDKTPSMDTRNNFYYCYSCGRRGDAIDLVMQRDHASFVEAVQRLCA